MFSDKLKIVVQTGLAGGIVGEIERGISLL